MPRIVVGKPPAADVDTARNLLRRVFDNQRVLLVVALQPATRTDACAVQIGVVVIHTTVHTDSQTPERAGRNPCGRQSHVGYLVVVHRRDDTVAPDDVYNPATTRAARNHIGVVHRTDAHYHDARSSLHVAAGVQPVAVVGNDIARLVRDVHRAACTAALLAVAGVRVAVGWGVGRDVAHARIDDTAVYHAEHGVRPIWRGRYPLKGRVRPVPREFVVHRDTHLEWRGRRVRRRLWGRGTDFRFLAIKAHGVLRGQTKSPTN